MDSFLRQVARSVVETTEWNELSKTTFVLPSHRAGLVLKNELMQIQQSQRQGAVWAPDVKTLQQLQDALSPLYAEDELMTVVRLYKLYSRLEVRGERLEEPLSLDMFYNWGRQMIADFTNVDASMPAEQVPNFFENTIAAHELSQLELDEGGAERLRALVNGNWSLVNGGEDSIRKQYEQVWKNLYTLYEALRAEMVAERKGYSGLRQRAVIEHWDDESVQEQLKGRTFVFVGFNYLLPVERELMVLLRDAGQAKFYWDYVPDFQTNEKAFEFTRKNKAILGDSGERLAVSGEREPKEVTVMACTSREAQAQYVHRWLQENYTVKGQKVGVVICDETLLESVIYTLPAITLDGETAPAPVNITKGFPLRNTAIYTQVLSWLYDRARGDAEQEVVPEIIEDLLAALIPEEPESPENPEKAALPETGMKWQELLIMESEYQVRKIANQMRKLIADGIGVPFTLKMLRLLMRRTMENVTMPFHGEPVTDIQVMGVLETRLLDFDKLLLLNVEEGVLPQKQADGSFIPYYLRKAYSMQTSDERATVYAYNFFRLMSRTGHSTLLFTTADGAENSKGMSRFIMQMMVNPEEFTVTKACLEEPSVLRLIDDARLETDGVSLMDGLHTNEEGMLCREDGSWFSLSPSALNTYIDCPRKFCLQYIKHEPEPEQEEKEFSPATLGSFVHNAMLYLYRDRLACEGTGEPVKAEDIAALLADETMPDEAVEKAYEMMNAECAERHEGEQNHYIRAQHWQEEPVIKEYLRRILLRDQEDAQRGLKIQLLEQDCRFDLTIPDTGKIRTGGKIDRMDILGEGEDAVLRIVDYKSGSFDEKYLKTTMNELMNTKDAKYIRQTMLYSLAAVKAKGEGTKGERAIEPNLYFCRRNLVGQKTTLTIDEQEVHDFRAIEKAFLEAYTAKVHEVLHATTFPPCEPKQCAAFCPFLGICSRKVSTSE